MNKSKNINQSDTVGFRLPSVILSVLEERASLQKSTRNKYARSLLIESLFQSERIESINRSIEECRIEARQLRQDLAFSMKTLLMTAGKIPEKDAENWIIKNFKF